MTKEIWRDINGYDGYYQVSTEASRTEIALIIALNKLLTKTNIVANSYIIYDVDNRKTYKGNF